MLGVAVTAALAVRAAACGAGSSVFCSLAAWVAGVPLVACRFGLFTPVAVAANVAVLFLAPRAVWCCAAALAAGFVSARLAAAYNLAAALCVKGMVAVSEFAAAIPSGSFAVRAWTPLECAAWYGAWMLVLILLAGLRRRAGGREEYE